jgi:hypothetical protein
MARMARIAAPTNMETARRWCGAHADVQERDDREAWPARSDPDADA